MNDMAPDPPTIRIEPAARDYLAARGDALTLRGSRRHGCCGGTAFVPIAEAGAPSDPEGYRTFEMDGVTVFLEADITTGAEPMVVGLDALWRWQRLRVEGTAMRM
jgi:hypothetical protein